VLNLFAHTYSFGVVPQQSPQKLYKAWQPFIEHLSNKTGHQIIFKTEKSIPAFEKNLYSGKYDIAYSNPYHFVIAQLKQDHEAIARFNKKIVGILVVKKDSKIKNLSDIKDKTILFPAPKAFAATILTKYEVLEKIDYDIEKSKNFRYVNSHDSVYKGVQRDIGQIGGGIMRTFNKFQDKDQLRILYKTNSYPSHPISISKNIDKEFITKLKEALLSTPKDILKAINPKELIITDSNEYNTVKKLAEKLDILKK
jgi:phosphonate transport system substrate-binding protein